MDEKFTVSYKSKAFAVRIVHLHEYLCTESRAFDLARQVLRSGTSIGANIAEAGCAISRKEFLAKMYIAYKECVETLYWLEILYRTDYISEAQFCSLEEDCIELRKMLSSITKTMRENLRAADRGANS